MTSIFQKPSWYHGLYPANNLAATIRDSWFAFLGSTQGFPYSTSIFNQVILSIKYVLNPQPWPLSGPVNCVVQVLDSSGNLVGQVAWSVNPASSPTGTQGATISGNFSTQEQYTIQVVPAAGQPNYTLAVMLATGGVPGPSIANIPGGLLSQQSQPYPFQLIINPPAS